MHTPTIFCPTCGRYLGAAATCIFCGWERPAALRIPAAGAPLWRLPTAAPADGQPLRRGRLVSCWPTGGRAGRGFAGRRRAPLALGRRWGRCAACWPAAGRAGLRGAAGGRSAGA